MPRAKGGPKTRQRRNKILKAAKGYRGAKSRLIRNAKETLDRGLRYATRHRKLRKRDFRKLWIARVGAAARENGISYSQLMGKLLKTNVAVNRKMLSEMAIHDPAAFSRIVQSVK